MPTGLPKSRGGDVAQGAGGTTAVDNPTALQRPAAEETQCPMDQKRWTPRTRQRDTTSSVGRRGVSRVLLYGAVLLVGTLAGPVTARAATPGVEAAAPSATQTAPAAPGADPAPVARLAPGALSLTFDDGPAGYTAAVLDVLAEHQVTATFCVVGTQAQRNPTLLRRIVAEGHALCNHSMNHADLATMTPEQVRADLTAADAAIRQAVPDVAVPYFRAPYGSWGGSVAVAQQLGMSRLGWTVDPRDWSRPGTDAIVQAVLTQLRPGGIVLLHDGGGDRSQTVAALGILIPRLVQDGWTFRLPPVTPPPPVAG